MYIGSTKFSLVVTSGDFDLCSRLCRPFCIFSHAIISTLSLGIDGYYLYPRKIQSITPSCGFVLYDYYQVVVMICSGPPRTTMTTPESSPGRIWGFPKVPSARNSQCRTGAGYIIIK